MSATVIHSADELVEWAQDEGALDDTVLFSVDQAAKRLELGLRIVKQPATPRDSFLREVDLFHRFTLTAVAGGVVRLEDEPALPSPIQVEVPQEGEAFGLDLTVDGGRVVVLGTVWEAEFDGERTLPVKRWLDPESLTLHGDGPIGVDALRAGAAVDCFANWQGSGQRFGAALLGDVPRPLPVPAGTELSGAWRVVPAGAEAGDPRGVWLTGQSRQGYVTIHREAGSSAELLRAVTEALAGLPGLTWGTSGNTLVEGQAARAAWLALGSRS